jgi:ubiquinone/menaquinone biosynthesis C-methylase UbiE
MKNKKFHNSYIVNKKVNLVKKEYSISSKQKKENKKVKWGSYSSMINRFKISLKILKKRNYRNWLDIGSGTGKFFLLADKINFKTDYRVGVEMSKNLLKYSKKKKYKFKTQFVTSDIMQLRDNKKYELVTLIGVLQNCGYQPDFFLKKIIQKVKNKGILFLTSKNINWKKFKEKKIFPEKNYSWFDIKDIEFCLKKLKVKVLKKGGFIPNKNRIVKINCAHSFFILAKKNI